MLQGEDDLDQPGHPGRRLQMPDVGLHRADHERIGGGAARPEHDTEGLDLDGIAEHRPGAVSLHVRDASRIDLTGCQRLPDHGLLGRTIRGREAAAGAVLVHGSPADDRQDPVPRAQRVAEPLEDDDATALALHEAIGGRVEGLAAPVGGQHARLAERDRVFRRQDEVHAADERHLTLAASQALTGQVKRDK